MYLGILASCHPLYLKLNVPFVKQSLHKKNVYAYLRSIHSNDSLAVNNFICTVCEKTFKVQKTIDSHHIIKYHTNGNGNREIKIICPYELNESLFKYSKLRIHLFEKHNITIEIKEIRFSTIGSNTLMNNNIILIINNRYYIKFSFIIKCLYNI